MPITVLPVFRSWAIWCVALCLVLGFNLNANQIDKISVNLLDSISLENPTQIELNISEIKDFITESEDRLNKANELFNSFLMNFNKKHNLSITRASIINFIVLHGKNHLTNESINTNIVSFLCRDNLPGELTPENLIGIVEVGIGALISIASGWTGGGAAIGGALIGHGLSQIIQSESDNLKNTGTWPYPPK